MSAANLPDPSLRQRLIALLAEGDSSKTALASAAGRAESTVLALLQLLEADGIAVCRDAPASRGQTRKVWSLTAGYRDTYLALCPRQAAPITPAQAAKNPASRLCLACQKPFYSSHAGVRICDGCKRAAERSGGLGIFSRTHFITH